MSRPQGHPSSATSPSPPKPPPGAAPGVAGVKASACMFCRRLWAECMIGAGHCCSSCREQGGHRALPASPRPNDDLDPHMLYERVRALTEENHRLAMRNASLEQRIIEHRQAAGGSSG